MMSEPPVIHAPARPSPWFPARAGGVLADPGTWVLGVNLVLVACYLVCLWFHWGGAARVTLIANLADLVLGLSLTGLTWRAARIPGLARHARLGWRLIALGFLAFWIGNVLWFRDEVMLGVKPFPSLADLGFLSYFPLVLAGLLCFIRPRESRAERIQFALDLCVITIGAGTLVWFFLLRPIAAAAYGSTLELVLTQAYPLGDTALLVALAALALKPRRDGSGAPLAWLMTGLSFFFLADTSFAYQTVAQTYVAGGVTDALYNLGYVTTMVGPYLAVRRGATAGPSAPPPVQPGRGFVLLPYLSVAAVEGLLLLVVFDWVSGSARGQSAGALGGLVLAGAILTVLTMIRQAIAARELARLRAEQAIRQTGARFASLVRHSSDVISLLGPDLCLSFVSPAVQRVLGLAPEALTGRPLLDLLHPEDRPHVAGFLACVLAGRAGTAVTQWRLCHADGSWRDIETLVTNLTADPAVGGLVLNSRDVTERRRLEERLRFLAFQDPLTGLANRTLLRERLDQALARAARSQHPITLLYLDLDDFKTVNDSLGHAAGDALLRIAAERLRQCARASDTVARLGGDELAVLIEDPLPLDDAVALATRIGARLAEPMALCGRQMRVTASIGIAQGGAADEVDTLLANADLAMYSIKASGKQGYALFKPEMHTAALERIDLEHDLRRGLERGEFLLHYQPIIHLATKTLAGVEALVCWQHPRRGLLYPEVFLPLAEEKGELMVVLGRWVLSEACRQGKLWQDLLPPGMPWAVIVNISVRQFQQCDLARDVDAALAASGLDPRSLVLEITESTLMQCTAETLNQLTDIKTRGLRLAIDDFGVGYSSLAYLHRFPVDILKLDRSFVATLGDDQEDAPLTRAIVAIGAMLQLETIAEGVELPRQAAELLRLGCPFAQGYLFSRPLDAATLSADWIASRQDPYRSDRPGPEGGGGVRAGEQSVGSYRE